VVYIGVDIMGSLMGGKCTILRGKIRAKKGVKK